MLIEKNCLAHCFDLLIYKVKWGSAQSTSSLERWHKLLCKVSSLKIPDFYLFLFYFLIFPPSLIIMKTFECFLPISNHMVLKL